MYMHTVSTSLINALSNAGGLFWKLGKYYSYFYVVTNYVVPVDLVRCEGVSMEPLIKHNDIVLCEKVSVRRKKLKTDDIVITNNPTDSQKLICKRLKSIGGRDFDYPEIKIPYGSVWLTGENQPVSKDSNEYGAIPYGLIKSRVFLRIWPLSEIQLFARNK